MAASNRRKERDARHQEYASKHHVEHYFQEIHSAHPDAYKSPDRQLHVLNHQILALAQALGIYPLAQDLNFFI